MEKLNGLMKRPEYAFLGETIARADEFGLTDKEVAHAAEDFMKENKSFLKKATAEQFKERFLPYMEAKLPELQQQKQNEQKEQKFKVTYYPEPFEEDTDDLLKQYQQVKSIYREKGLTKETASFDAIDNEDFDFFVENLIVDLVTDYLSEHKYKEGIAYCDELLSMFPPSEVNMDVILADRCTMISECYGFDKAEEAYEEAFKLLPRNECLWASYSSNDLPRVRERVRQELADAKAKGIPTTYLSDACFYLSIPMD